MDALRDGLRFDGRSVVVTGAGRGVGRAHAVALAARGSDVVVADLGAELDGSGSSSAPADDVVAEIRAAGGSAVACHASVADESGAASIVRAALDAFGRIDAVVNNAGIVDPDWFEDMSPRRFRAMIDVHYLGTADVALAAWPHMIAAGYGRIVNTCSEAAFGVVPKATGYGGAKGGVLSLTRALAYEGRRHGITANAVCPRAQTRLSGPSVMAKTHDLPESAFVDGRLDRFAPELVSAAAVFLAHESCELSGEVLIAGGGQVMRMAMVANRGISSEGMTPEHLAANLAEAMDLSSAQEIRIGHSIGT